MKITKKVSAYGAGFPGCAPKNSLSDFAHFLRASLASPIVSSFTHFGVSERSGEVHKVRPGRHFDLAGCDRAAKRLLVFSFDHCHDFSFFSCLLRHPSAPLGTARGLRHTPLGTSAPFGTVRHRKVFRLCSLYERSIRNLRVFAIFRTLNPLLSVQGW